MTQFRFRLIPLTRGYFASVDVDDYERLSKVKWYAHGKTRIYARSRTKGFMHHNILPRKKDFLPDHVSNDSLDNTKDNLRYVTASQNKLNGGPYSTEGQTSPYRGVGRRGARWGARITIDKKTVYLGSFETEQEAFAAYENKRAEVLP